MFVVVICFDGMRPGPIGNRPRDSEAQGEFPPRAPGIPRDGRILLAPRRAARAGVGRWFGQRTFAQSCD